MSTVVWEYITSALVSKNSRHLLKKSADTKPVITKSPAFSRALDNVVAFTMNSRGLLKLFSFFRLAVVFTLVFVLRHSVEKNSIQKFFFLLFLIGKRRHSVTTSSLINLLILFQLQISLT